MDDTIKLSPGLTVMRGLFLLLLFIWCTSAQQGFIPNNFQVKLTSERGGPPSGAQFVPIPVVDIPPFTGPKPLRMTKRPKVGQPPPPPPPIASIKPTRRPKPPPTTGGHIAPPPPAKPVPVDQSIPQSTATGTVPALPPDVTVVTPMTEVRPDQEAAVMTSVEPPTTTPRARDYLPAWYQRFTQNEDLSYYFDFEAPNSVARTEQGFFKRDAFFENPIHVKTGTYSFTSPEGVAFRVNYVADERGFRTFMSVA